MPKCERTIHFDFIQFSIKRNAIHLKWMKEFCFGFERRENILNDFMYACDHELHTLFLSQPFINIRRHFIYSSFSEMDFSFSLCPSTWHNHFHANESMSEPFCWTHRTIIVYFEASFPLSILFNDEKWFAVEIPVFMKLVHMKMISRLHIMRGRRWKTGHTYFYYFILWNSKKLRFWWFPSK